MKIQYAVTLTLLAGVAIGAIAVQGLRAQAGPPVYVITLVDASNPDGYSKEYSPKAAASIKAAGGHRVAAGGLGGGKITALEGSPPMRAVVNQFDSLEKAEAWRNSDAYKEARKIGNKYAKFNAFAIEGVSQ
jgi:uncharacterized protein (DUF1330 family)